MRRALALAGAFLVGHFSGGGAPADPAGESQVQEQLGKALVVVDSCVKTIEVLERNVRAVAESYWMCMGENPEEKIPDYTGRPAVALQRKK